MMNKILKVMLVVIISFTCFAKEYKEGDTLYVWANSGMNFRKTPSPTGEIIMPLKYGTRVEVIKQDKRIPFSYPLFKNKEGVEAFILKGHWLKVRVGEKEGYVFDKLLLKYPTCDYFNKEYVINYFKKNFGVRLVEDKLEEVKDEEDEIYNIYTMRYASKDEKTVINFDISNGYDYYSVHDIGSITVSDMEFDEAILFLSTFKGPEENYLDTMEIKEGYIYYDPTGIPSDASICKEGNEITLNWAILAD